jgi:hypothetical protein
MTTGQPNDLLHIGARGKYIPVRRRTLTMVEGSVLASMFSGRWDEGLQKDIHGYIFVDYPIELFRVLVDYLHAKSIEISGLEKVPLTKQAFGGDTDLFRDYLRMVEAYGLTEALYPF